MSSPHTPPPETKIDLCEINQELIRTRQKGYCILYDELTEGKEPLAAISVSASAHRLNQQERVPELAKAVLTAAGKISGKLGYYPK